MWVRCLDLKINEEWVDEHRTYTEIFMAEAELEDKIWYNRHQIWLEKIETGKQRIVENVPGGKYKVNETPKEIFDGARFSAKKVEEQYGIVNLGPWSDFEWGMMNGKLSALRWVIGNEWDFLDT